MDKKEFLSALEQSLSVLQEDELRDIISEYEQHIDIKVEKGLTEAEVIADFGSFSELTSEILEAYHVRADYGTEKEEEGRRIPASGAPLSRIKAACSRAGRGIRWLSSRITASFRWIWERGRTFLRMSGKKRRSALQEAAGSGYDEEEAGRSADQGQTENDSRKDTGTEIRENRGSGGFAGRWREIRKRKGEGHMAGSTIGRGIRTAVRWVTDGGRLAGRLLWNGCWMIFSLTVFGFGLFFLYILGILIILLMQGYPLTGILLGCIGLVMCAFSAGVLGMSFRIRRRSRAREEEEETEHA